MESNDGLSESVKEFLREHVSSVEQLEILLYIFRSAPQAHSPEEIAQALYISPESAHARLKTFSEKGLVRETGEHHSLYAFEPRDSNIIRKIQDLTQCYKERRVAVINYIFSNPISTIQSFADAFVFGKKKE